jgi:Fic family protein
LSPIWHKWESITDISDDDISSASDELPALVSTWDDVKSDLDPAQIHDFQERLSREWAIETGIIEHIYTLDVGVTQTLIEHGIDASLIPADATDKSPELVAGIISDQQSAVDVLFSVVREERPLTGGFIKELHALMTRRQTTVDGIDQFGNPTEMPLAHGEYKLWPNNPNRPDGSVHEYAPPVQVQSEMDRLLTLHEEHIVLEVPVDVEAAWLHHRFTQIHPFQDGNGRIARALATLILIKGGWFPLVVTRDDRPKYISALEAADDGSLVPLIRLFGEIERRAFLRALSIASDVQRESERVDQVIAAIGDMFQARDSRRREHFDQAKETAHAMWEIAHERFTGVSDMLEDRLGRSADRRIFVDVGRDDDPVRRLWSRYQVIESAIQLDYYASPAEFHEWVRLGLVTEGGRSEILLSFHGIGRVYRGIIGATITFYRREEGDDIEHQIVGHDVPCDEVFQINYAETQESVERRFRTWLERALVRSLDVWRRSE